MAAVFNIYDQHAIKSIVGTGERLIDSDPSLLSNDELLKFTYVNSAFVLEAKEKHSSITRRLPQFPIHLYKDNEYVIAGGIDKYWYVYSVIKVIKNLGSNLPVEIIIPTIEDYNENFCKHSISNLNAKYILVPEVYGFDVIKKYNLKEFGILSIFTSSFNKILYLNNYNYPISKPDQIFASVLLQQNVMILWSDHEPRTTSLFFFLFKIKKLERLLG